jgi:hypothetical protein
MGNCWRYCFRSSKDFYCSVPHSTFVEPRSTVKKGKLFSASFTINLFNTTMWPASFCTSFLVRGGCIWRIAFILLGLASMPFMETNHPNTLPRITPKTHLSRLSLSLASHILVKVSVRSEMYEAFFLLATMMLLT